MAVLEKISEVMQQNEVMKKGLRKTMSMLMNEWKSFEEVSDLTTKGFQQCFDELEVREKHLSSVKESVVESSHELDLIRESVEQRRKEVEVKEEEFCAFRETEIRDLECHWKDLILVKHEFDEAVKLREKKLNEQEKMGERLLGEIENLEKSVENRFMEISMKEKEFEEKLNKVREESDALHLKERKFAEDSQVKENILQSREKELETKLRSLDSARKELTMKENRLDTATKELETNIKSLDSARKELTMKEKRLDKATKEHETKVTSLDSAKNELTMKENRLDTATKELETKVKSLDSARKELTVKENRLTKATKELETKVTSLDSARKELTMKENRLCTARKELILKENRLDTATRELETKVMSLDSARKELTMKENRLDTATKELREKELREKAMLTKELQEKTSNVDSLKKKLTIKEDHLTSMKKELAHKDKSLGTIKNQLELQGLELNLLEGKVQLREGELSSIRKELREKVTMLDSVTKVLQGKTSDLNSLKKQLSINKDHLTSMKKKLEDKDKSVDTIRDKLELKEQEFNLLEERHQLREGELSSCKRELREKVTMLDSVTKELQGKTSNLDSLKKKLTINEDHLTTMKKKLEHKDKSVDTIKNKLELKEQELNLLEERLQLREGELSSVQEGYRQPSEELDSTKKKLDLVNGEFQLEKEKYQTEQGLFKKSMKDIELKEKQVEVKFREVEQREKHMEDWFKVLEEKMKQLKTIGNAPEPIDNVEADTTSTDSADIKLVLTMDGKALQIFLNEHEKKLDSMSDDVFRTLHLSRNPAQLVLDAMEGFYPPHLMMMKGDTEFEGSVARKTCILLLEQLIRVSPKIQPTVRERAMKLASEWKFKMTGNQLEILGFLYLLASFNLVFAFDPDELMNLLAVVAEHNKSKELCRLLGFTEKIPCFKADVTASVISEAQKPQQTQLKHKESTSPSVRADIKALSYTSSTGKASTCMLGHSNAMAAILVSMGGKNLQTFLNNHWKEQELLRIEISRALKLSSDSGMLVLEALEGFYPPGPHNEEILFARSVIRKSCIFLLEQLMILSPKLKPEAKLEARKLAFDWKEKMKAETEDHLGILGFLLLVGAYGLASAFDKDELESLCHTAAQDDNAYPIFHVLGIAGEHPSKTQPLSNNVEMKRKGCDLTSGCSLSFIHFLSDPAKVVLDALRKCRSANLGKYKYGPLVMKSFSDLLEHLREVSPEITPQVKIDAIVLAVEWQKTFTGSQLNPSEVLGFLQLLATFELSSSFDSDELLRLLKIVYNSTRAINLFKILELADKIPCFIENLIKRKQWLLAIRYIYVYELVDLFPPVPLLKDYVLYSKEQAKKIRDNGLGSREAQEKAINCEISVLRAAIKCILSRNLQSEYSPDILRARIAKLQRQMADLRIPNQHSGDDRDEGTLCAPASQVQKAATKKRLASATEGVAVHESRLQHSGDDRGEGTLCAPICQVQKAATQKRLASATKGVTVHESRQQHSGDDRDEGTLCAPICQVQKAATQKRLASATEGVTVHESRQQHSGDDRGEGTLRAPISQVQKAATKEHLASATEGVPVHESRQQHCGDDRGEGTLCAPICQVQKAATNKRRASATEGVTVHESRQQHSGHDRDEGTLCAPISQVQKAATKKRLASATEGVTAHESRQQKRKHKRVCQLPMQTEVCPDSIICNASLSSSQPTSTDAQFRTVTPNYSKEVFSQPLEGYSADDQICGSGQASSHLIGGSHAYDDAKVETGKLVLPVQASCHTNHSDHSVITSSVPQSLWLPICPFYDPGENLMPKLEELLSKLQNACPAQGRLK
ncbi:uncharacterized protein LOC132068717 isoform X2 [Lycium ferocissimum]|uniref:uncharacterized protein LOC132068717 isoform X2 n=1 Tax=Lycium ferocissimum TaxID=112874 RepID=UPI0028168420|nr:uncharacterized protein LOC132068717 isoform X2 [Lycium ferocissimum]